MNPGKLKELVTIKRKVRTGNNKSATFQQVLQDWADVSELDGDINNSASQLIEAEAIKVRMRYRDDFTDFGDTLQTLTRDHVIEYDSENYNINNVKRRGKLYVEFKARRK